MKSKLPVILIFDAGKTNKKVLLFDKQYQLVYEESVQLPETTDEDGFPCEDVSGLRYWVSNIYQELLANEQFEITAINVSAYGASLVNLNDKLQPFLPIYNYLKPYPEALLNQFYNTYDKDGNLEVELASPKLGHLNSGMQLYWLKYERPENYKRIQCSLHLPQFISFILGGTLSTGITSIGCHTNLWSFNKNNYHSWVFKEAVNKKFAPLAPASAVNYNSNTIAVGTGLHDSSAALIPYMAAFNEPFVVLSTGTWCVSLNPFNASPLTGDDLAEDCLCYLSYKGRAIKASRLFAGNEHELQNRRLAAHFMVSPDYYKTVRYNSSFRQNKKESAFNLTDLNKYVTYEDAYHQLMAEIITKQRHSLMLIIKDAPVKNLYVDGGFSKNDVFMYMLADAFADIRVYAATVAQSSALGAAIAIKDAWNNRPLPENLVSLTCYS